VTPTLSPSSGSEPAIVAGTPGVSPSAAPAKSDVPTQVPSVPATPAAPPSAGAIDALALAEPSADFFRIPCWGSRPVATSYFLVQTGAPIPIHPPTSRWWRPRKSRLCPGAEQAVAAGGLRPLCGPPRVPDPEMNGLTAVAGLAGQRRHHPETADRHRSVVVFLRAREFQRSPAAHTLAARATDAYENARATVARFLGASSARDIVFVRGATEAINLVAQAWGGQFVSAGDEIVITHLEHHANIVPWQQLCAKTGARLLVAPVNDRAR